MNYALTLISRNRLALFMFAALLVLGGFAFRLHATATTYFTTATPAGTGENNDWIDGTAWNTPEAIADGDVETVAASAALEPGFAQLPDVPTTPDGTGYQSVFTHDGRYLATVDDTEDGGLLIIDMQTLTVVADTPQPVGSDFTIAASPDGHYLALGGNGGLTIINTIDSDPANWSIVSDTYDPAAYVGALAFSPDSQHLALSVDRDERLDIVQTSDWTLLTDGDEQPLDFGIGGEDECQSVGPLAFSHNGDFLVAGIDCGGELLVINPANWTVVPDTLPFESLGIAALAFSPDDSHLMVSSVEGPGTMSVIDTSSSDPTDWTDVRDFEPNDVDQAWGFSFSPDGNTLAVAYEESPFIGIVDTSSSDPADWAGVDTSESIGTIEGGKAGGSGNGVTFSPDGNYLAAPHDGGTGLTIITTQMPATTEYLLAHNFGFSIPSDATIVGVEATVSRSVHDSTDRAEDNGVELFVGGSRVGDTRSVADTWWSSDGEDATYGSDSDLWDNDLTPAQVNDESFGVGISATVDLGTAEVSGVTMTISYTLPDSPVVHHHSSGGGSIQEQVQNLAASGDQAGADAVAAQWPSIYGTTTPSGSTTVGGAPITVRDLTLTMTGDDVKALQTLLISQNTGAAAQALATIGATGYFGSYTKNALAEYQAAHGITPAIGYFGAITRAQMKLANLAGLWW